jgi:gluconate 5-dehydrogenase
LGKGIAAGLADHGATVVVLGRDEDKFHEAFAKANRSIAFRFCDIGSADSIREGIASVEQKHARVDVLINNAFFTRGNDPERLSDADWDYGVDGTLSSVFRAIREAIPFLKAGGRGKIINVASMYGLVSPRFGVYEDAPDQINPPHYGAAKAGVIQLTRYYAAYLAKFGINVNSISVGAFPAPRVQANAQFISNLTAQIPLGRIGTPDDLKGAFVFLSSAASDYITGHNLVVDGGWTAW